jgi:hypothetical protein
LLLQAATMARDATAASASKINSPFLLKPLPP